MSCAWRTRLRIRGVRSHATNPLRFITLRRTWKTGICPPKWVVLGLRPTYWKTQTGHLSFFMFGATRVPKHGDYRFYGQIDPHLMWLCRLMTLYIRDRHLRKRSSRKRTLKTIVWHGCRLRDAKLSHETNTISEKSRTFSNRIQAGWQ